MNVSGEIRVQPIRGSVKFSGDVGPQGKTGPIGPAINLIIGTVENGEEAKVWITGDPPNQTLHFIIPKGDTGERGEKGEVGNDGKDGTEIELQATNTHIQWRYVGASNWNNLIALSLLKGDSGKNGIDGQNGKDGRGIVSFVRASGTGSPGTIDTYTITYTDNTTTILTVYNGKDGEGSGDMHTTIYDTNNNGIVDNSEKVNGHTVESDVPSNAKFTDTVYDDTVVRQLINESLIEAKQYTDEEIATFDFIKIVDVLPETGLPNRFYFVPKTDTQTQDLFDEYAWLNKGTEEIPNWDWEWITTKQIEIDLSNIYSKTESNEKFAKLELYGDSTINVGRKAGSNVGEFSTALGKETTPSGYAAHSEGVQTNAYGTGGHSEGAYTVAVNNFSHTEGYSTIAEADYAHTEGKGTHAKGEASHVQGKYNIVDTANKYAHIVGNGDDENNRSNGHTVDWNGAGWFAGELKVGGTGQDDANALKVLASNVVTEILTGTQAQYDSLGTYNSTTLYLIQEEA